MSSSAVADSGADAFRAGFRHWLVDNTPGEWQCAAFPRTWPPGAITDPGTTRALEWHLLLQAGGWIAPGWPRQYGGLGLDLNLRLVMLEEFARMRSPVPIGYQGIDTLGPALIQFGTLAQQQRFLPRILSAEDIWCQGYSEPSAGSDLASMITHAVRDGDEYVINGQKVWTTNGRRANWCFLLARTGPKETRSRGISFFLASMDSPGIEWRPIRQMTGETDDFGELFLEGLRVPVSQRLGEEGQGWQVAMHSLAFERLLASNVAPLRVRMNALLENARKQKKLHAELRARILDLELRTRAAGHLQAIALNLVERGDSKMSAWVSALKLATSQLRQQIADTAVLIDGGRCVTSGPLGIGAADPQSDISARWAYEVLEARSATIYAGTSEIQRNIISEVGLGLPR